MFPAQALTLLSRALICLKSSDQAVLVALSAAEGPDVL
jgi:hypothetical protein